MQYYLPSEPDTFVGDPMPFWHDGVFHIYYILDHGHHSGNAGLGGHEWAHVSTRDLRTWDRHPLAVRLGMAGGRKEESICTGSVCYHDGVLHAYYAVRLLEPSGPLRHTEHVCHASGSDGITFTKDAGNPILPPPAGYHPGGFRDPHVFAGPDGRFHMLVTTELVPERAPGLPMSNLGCIAHFTSDDLDAWNEEEPILVPGYASAPECPDWFAWNGWYYLTFLDDGLLRYRMSRDPFGPWHKPVADMLDGNLVAAMKTAAYSDDRRFAVGFVRSRENGHDEGDFDYAGNLVIREMVQDTDGTLWSTLPAELMPETGGSLDYTIEAKHGDVSLDPAGVRIDAPDTLGVAAISTSLREGIVRFTAHTDDASAFGLFFRSSDDMSVGYEARFRPRERMIWMQRIDGRRDAGNRVPDTALVGVKGLNRVECTLVLKDDLVDLSVNGRRTLIGRFPEWSADRLSLFCDHGSVVFENLEMLPFA